MSRKTVHGLFYIVSRTHLMHFVSLRGQYRQNQYLYTHHIVHPSGFHGFLSLHALLYRIFQHGSLEMGCLCHIFPAAKGGTPILEAMVLLSWPLFLILWSGAAGYTAWRSGTAPAWAAPSVPADRNRAARLSAAAFRNGIDHIEDVVGDAGGADGFHILCGDYIPVQTIADQLLQLHLDISISVPVLERRSCAVFSEIFSLRGPGYRQSSVSGNSHPVP